MATLQAPWVLNQKQQDAVIKYFETITAKTISGESTFRDDLLERDKIYAREVDLSKEHTRAKNANKGGDQSKIQNITVPVVMPQVESGVAYLTGVFLSQYPIFPVVASPKNIQSAQAINALMTEHSMNYSWVRELMKSFRDGLKYNFGAIEAEWITDRTYSIDSQDPKTGKGIPSEVTYQGNKITRIDPYNIIIDTRVNPANAHVEAEYIGYHELYTRPRLSKLLDSIKSQGNSMNFDKAMMSSCADVISGDKNNLYYVPEINNPILVNLSLHNINWGNFFDGNTRDDGKRNFNPSGLYVVSKLYCRILPADLGLPAGTGSKYIPQIWKFYIVNGKHVVFAERQSNAHEFIPILISQPNEDGLGYQTKSVQDNSTPFQQFASAMWNSAIASKRRQVYDRIIYNPQLIRKEDIDSASEVARIPMRTAAYNKNPSEAIYQIPYRDDGVASTIQIANQVVEMSQFASGYNRVQQGQFQKGNKTQDEFNSVMTSANLRQQMQALSIEYQVFQPLKQILKYNILQYQPDGITIFDRETKSDIQINMGDIRKIQFTFQVSDGLLTAEKMISPELIQVFLQTASAIPQFSIEYDLAGMFIYWMKVRGATWMDDFKRTPEEQQQALNTMQQTTQAQEPQNAG